MKNEPTIEAGVGDGAEGAPGDSRARPATAAVAQLVGQALLDRHTPPAVVVTAAGHLVYIHGDTSRFLRFPGGIPTRDLLAVVNEQVRDAVRTALQRAANAHVPVTIQAGLVDTPTGRHRVEVEVAPLDCAEAAPLYLVTFGSSPQYLSEADSSAANQLAEDLQRVRNELQGALEEMQTSNEELRASHEEATSLNDELQSANEELATSKEETHSLNEQLVKVNAQLQAKMAELERTANDLASLLTSIDIPVLFLDPGFRIRRFTPATNDLIDLIPSDVGRPITDLRQKFSDSALLADAEAVLDKLIPIEKAIDSKSGRHYLRRILPYRTQDHRIDGVVIAFVDVTARRRAEESLRDREAWLQGQQEALEAALNDAPLATSLAALVRTANEALGEGTRAAVYLANDDGETLHHLIGMSPEDTGLADGCPNGTESPARELAAHQGQPLLTADIMIESRWETWRSMAAEVGFQGCWSSPIHTAAGKYVGSFVIFSRQPRVATDRDTALTSLMTHTASIIISRHQEKESREKAEAARKQAEERLRLALAAARMGIWTLDATTGMQIRDANLNRLLGLEPVETAQPFTEFLDHVRMDYRSRVHEAFNISLRDGLPLNIEFRVVRPDGTECWLRDQGDVFGNAAADRRHMAGACVDVTERRAAEDAARAGEERLRLILSSATDFIILTLAPDRTVTTWSPGAADAFGYTADEIVGRSGDLLFVPEDRAAMAPENEAERALHLGRAADERWHLRKDGTRFYASGVTRPLRDGGGFVKVARDLTERKRLDDELRAARDQLEVRVAERTAELEMALDALEAEMTRRRDLARQLSTAQEDERRRVARDLHDTIGQLLAGLSLALKSMETSGDLSGRAGAKLAEAQRMMSDLGREVHGLALRLRPTSLDDIGLEAALGQLVSEWSSQSGVRAEFHVTGLERLPSDIETAVYRVVQEALTNIAKHARASAIGVLVTSSDGVVSVVVEDNGVGFDPTAKVIGRLGLLGIRERVELVGGEVDIESRPGEGTTVAIQFPLLSKEAKS